MKTSTQNSNNAATAALTLKNNIYKSPLGKTRGSVAWLLNREIVAHFGELTTLEGVFRAAELHIGDRSCVVAAENYYTTGEDSPAWLPKIGIHAIQIAWDGDRGAESAFGVSMTPPARKLVEDAASIIRKEFAAWVEGDAKGNEIAIEVVTHFVRFSQAGTETAVKKHSTA